MKIRFYLKKNDINKSGECPIRADINIRGTRLQKLIGYTCSADKWDDVKEQVKHGAINKEGKDYRVINSRITDIRTHFTTYDLTLDDKPTSEAMLKEFQKVMNKNAAKIAAISSKDSEEVIEKKVAAAEEKEPKVKVKPAVDYMDEFINEESRIKEWSMETRKMVKSLKNHLNKFKKNVGLDFYDQNGIDKFINYLRSTAGLEESSAEKVYKNLAWFLRWAIRKKYTQVRDIESYEPVFKTVKKPVIFLTQDELDKVFNLEIPKTGTKLKLHDMNGKEYEKKVIEHEGMSIARDLFCFCAFTSLRYSDVVEVRRTDIHDGVLTITTQKTHDRLPIVLHQNALAILEKYKDKEFPGNRAAPEAETATYLRLLDRLRNPVAVLSIHSQGSLIYWICGQNETDLTAARRLTEIAESVTGYYAEPEDSFVGALADWAMLEKHIPAVTIETGLGGSPLPLTQQPEIAKRLGGLILAVADGM